MRCRIHHVAISVRNMQESVDFYRMFGFNVVIHYVDPAGAFELAHMKLEDAFLELWCYTEQVAAPESAAELNTDLPRIGVKHFALEVPSVDEALRHFEHRGIPIEVQRREGNTGVVYFFVKDPSGNLLEVLEDKRDF